MKNITLRPILKVVLSLAAAAVIGQILYVLISLQNMEKNGVNSTPSLIPQPTQTTQEPTPSPIPISYIIPLESHVFQTFNNCGPAALSMAMSYHNIDISQQVLGNSLRPFQNRVGDNDDKSVTLEELAVEAESHGLLAYHRPAGNVEILKYLISNDIPVIARTWLRVGEDIGHYRVVRGYDEERGILIQDDSLQNKNLEYSYRDFNELWKAFNYEYLVIGEKMDKDTIERALGENLDNRRAWEKAETLARKEVDQNPSDIYPMFNLSVARYNLGQYQKSVEAFEQVENRLPPRMLWYQIEPILAYYQVGNYERVLEEIDHILTNDNRAFSELYYIRGKIYENQGFEDRAEIEYDLAHRYNSNFNPEILGI